VTPLPRGSSIAPPRRPAQSWSQHAIGEATVAVTDDRRLPRPRCIITGKEQARELGERRDVDADHVFAG
jgi:hypothetical protein